MAKNLPILLKSQPIKTDKKKQNQPHELNSKKLSGLPRILL